MPAPPSRRSFLKAAAALAAGLPGCLYNAHTEIPASPAKWKAFRFVHVGGLALTFDDGGESYRWAMDGAEKISGLPEIDFLVLGSDLVSNKDPQEFSMLEDFLGTVSLPWFAVPGELNRRRETAPAGCFSDWAGSVNARAWAPAPWIVSPAEGVQLVGIDSGLGTDGTFKLDSQIPFLTSALDAHPLDAFIVITHLSPRVGPAAKRLGTPAAPSEMLRFVLESSDNVKMVLAGSVRAPFVKKEAGLLYVGTPPLASYPHLFREITVIRHGAVVRNRPVGPPWVREKEKAARVGRGRTAGSSPYTGEVEAPLLDGSEPVEKIYALR
jgi:hypothetical protein